MREQDEAHEVVRQVVPRENDEERDHEPRLREHEDPDHEHDEQLVPVKRYFARATAARNATTIESATDPPTTIRLFFTVSQK